MSKIFEALRQAELNNAERSHSNTLVTRGVGTTDRRRTKRASVQIPLFIYGYTAKDAPFFEEAHTIEINAHGALISMRTLVPPGERLLLTNATNQRTQECTVVSATARADMDVVAAVEFSAPAPHFWRQIARTPAEKLS